MFELTIKNTVYQFNFGMGFMKEINKTITKQIEGATKGQVENVGMGFRIAGVVSYDAEALSEVLYYANRGFSPRVTIADIDEYIDTCNIDDLFEKVIDELKKSNVTKKQTAELIEAIEKEKAKRAAEE